MKKVVSLIWYTLAFFGFVAVLVFLVGGIDPFKPFVLGMLCMIAGNQEAGK